LALGVIAFPVWYIILSLMVSQFFFFESQHTLLLAAMVALTSLISIRVHPLMVTFWGEMRVFFFRMFNRRGYALVEERRKHLMLQMDQVRADVFKQK
jgi:hypothetical protein